MRTTQARSALFGLATALAFAAGPLPPAPAQDKLYLPEVAKESAEPEAAIKAIRRPDDLKVTLFASEPRLANPVAFAIDDKGRFFVVETFRLHAGVTDNRGHMDWLDRDLASKTVADRVAMHAEWAGKDLDATYAVEHERIRLIEDRDGDGRTDRDSVFADGFRDVASGIAAGVLPVGNAVYFTCIPDLWKLVDTNGDGRADQREALSTGYGVHVSFLGHDLHGLILGPDGRLYFSIGDRGLDVVNKEGKRLSVPDTGSVLRCELDGSNLEVFASGLRNPQELAFDNLGNLFTVDNNSDSGDKARVVHLVEGGDSGWRIGYQYLEKPTTRGPWNDEKLWYPLPENTAAYLLPPLTNFSDGPSGLLFDPGVSLLPARFKDRFLLADFRGGAGQSGIRSFGVEPIGASFHVVDTQQPIWSILATDLAIAPDGGLYLSDWVDGWNKTGKGRIWRFADPSRASDPAVAEVKALLGAGFDGRSVAELTKLLGHADRRIREGAQFALVNRAKPGTTELVALATSARDGASLQVRLHGLWGFGQVARRSTPKDAMRAVVVPMLDDREAEIRASAARILGEITPRGSAIAAKLVARLVDSNFKVRLAAATALGHVGDKASTAPLIDLLRANDDRDPTLRHAASLALARIGDLEAIDRATGDSSRAVRLGAVLALRRIDPSRLARSLADADPTIALEAARAVYDDEPRPGRAMDALADRVGAKTGDVHFLRRAIHAAARIGGVARAESLARLASDRSGSGSIRTEAVELLGHWNEKSGRDGLSGLWRPYDARPRAEAADAIKGHLDDLLAPGGESTRRAAIEAIGRLGVAEAGAALARIAVDERVAPGTRIEALKTLERLGDPSLAEIAHRAAEAADEKIRAEAQRIEAKIDPAGAVPRLAKVLDGGSLAERQGAVAALAGLKRPEADALLARTLRSTNLPGEVELDLLEAAARRRDIPDVAAALAVRARMRSADDTLGDYRPIVLGGDPIKGRSTFEVNTAVECVRCHKVGGKGGEVGPDLTGIGGKQTREYIARSIVHPNEAIAQGFETVVVSTADGRVISGVFRSEDPTTLHLLSVEGKPIDLAKSEIEDRKRGPSAMPDDIAKKLSRSELRDLVAYLSGLK